MTRRCRARAEQGVNHREDQVMPHFPPDRRAMTSLAVAPPARRQESLIDRLADPVVLVDAEDRMIGTLGKLAAHRRGLRHSAVSVIVRDHDGRLMLQRRNRAKYHSGGLWANACCGHPRPGENLAGAAARRLNEEMGFSCPLAFVFRAEYRAAVTNGLTEHEIVRVFAGAFDGDPRPDPHEVDEWCWLTPDELRDGVDRNPERFAAWFRIYVRNYWPLIAGLARPENGEVGAAGAAK
jgi:isopentenyl-diphosphate delta-isomerase